MHKHGNRQGLIVFLALKDLAFLDWERNNPVVFDPPDRPSVLDHCVDGLRMLD